jgi:hypothetical protein
MLLGNPHTSFFATHAGKTKTLGNENSLPEVETTYDLKRLDRVQEEGRQYLIIPIVKNPELALKSILLRNKDTGEHKIVESRKVFAQYGRILEFPEAEWDLLHEVSGYARNRNQDQDWGAYILPQNLSEGERVYIPDLIEDFVATRFWGSVYPAGDAEAIWTGTELEIDHSAYNKFIMIG